MALVSFETISQYFWRDQLNPRRTSIWISRFRADVLIHYLPTIRNAIRDDGVQNVRSCSTVCRDSAASLGTNGALMFLEVTIKLAVRRPKSLAATFRIINAATSSGTHCISSTPYPWFTPTYVRRDVGRREASSFIEGPKNIHKQVSV